MDVKFFQFEGAQDVIPSTQTIAGAIELVANSTDAATEKHVPVVTVEGNIVRAEVGEVTHPMSEEHLIQQIVLVTKNGYQVATLTADGEPVASFALAEGDEPLKVYEYCNLHGLWVAEV